MSFVSGVFFPFLFLYLFVSCFCSQRVWLLVAAIASSVFYGYWDWRFLFLLYFVAGVSWYAGFRITKSTSEKERRLFVTLAGLSCLAVLAPFKYFNFFVHSFEPMAAPSGLCYD